MPMYIFNRDVVRGSSHCCIWVTVFKNGPSKICGRQPLKHFKWYGLPKQTISLQIFYRLSSKNFYLVTISLQIFYRLSFTNFTWSILEFLDPYMLLKFWWRLKAVEFELKIIPQKISMHSWSFFSC